MAVDITPSTLLEFAKTIDSEPQPMSKTRMAKVTRIGNDGTPYVTFPDGTETPLAGTVSTLKIGDSVMVSMQSGKLRANANVSDPAASNERMTRTETTALAAAKAANAASIAADAAEYDAQRAHEAADDAQASANSALASAANASEYASRALGNLSTVQSVSETLTWITQHGTMALTTDTALDPTHVYFVQDAEGDYVVGSTHYAIVAEPVASQLSSYYVLTIDESLNNYVGTHLALTNEGLWLIPASTNTYKVLIATGAGTTYTTAGTYIVDGSGGTVAKFGASEAQIGKSGAAHSVIDANGQRFYAVDGTTQLANIGYGEGNTESGTANAPYYTLGTRWANAASSYSASTTYTVGSLCYYNSELYICNTNISTAEAWTSSHWTKISKIIGNYSVSEGSSNRAIGIGSHAEGVLCNAVAAYSHAEGKGTFAGGIGPAHAEGADSVAKGMYSHAQNNGTIASRHGQTAIGTYNLEDGIATVHPNGNLNYGKYAFIVGNGTADNARSNAAALQWDGVLFVSGGYMLPNGSQIWDNTNRIIHMQTPDAGTAQAEFTFEPDGKIYSRKRSRSSAGASWGSWSSWTAIAG